MDFKALTHYTRNWKDFTMKVSEKIVAHIKKLLKNCCSFEKKIVVWMEDNCIFCCFVCSVRGPLILMNCTTSVNGLIQSWKFQIPINSSTTSRLKLRPLVVHLVMILRNLNSSFNWCIRFDIAHSILMNGCELHVVKCKKHLCG